MRVLLTGSAGQLGRELSQSLSVLGSVHAFTRAELDVCDAAAVRAATHAVRPHVIVNAAAFTAVDRAEREAELAHAVNARGAANLAEAAHDIGAMIVHFSTDYVFDGQREGAYREEDETRPLNAYGASKRAGELAVIQAARQHLVLRTSWLYASHGQNFLRTILRLARELPAREPLRVVNDQYGAPTWTRSLAAATALAIERSRSLERYGIFHVAACGHTTWFALAQRIVALAGIPRDVVPITSEAFGAPARRPGNSVLDCRKAAGMLGVSLPAWLDDVRACMSELAAPRPEPAISASP